MADRSLFCSLFRVFFRAYSVVLFETDIFRSGCVVGSTEKIIEGG